MELLNYIHNQVNYLSYMCSEHSNTLISDSLTLILMAEPPNMQFALSDNQLSDYH